MHVSLWLAIVLGAVQGLTEFLPVSSTGHLILVSEALHFSGEKASVFQVAVQFGSILAVVVLYFPRFWALIVPQKSLPFSGFKGLFMLFLTTLPPAVLGFFLHSKIKSLFQARSVVWALAVGGLLMLFVEFLQERKIQKRSLKGDDSVKIIESIDSMRPRLALGIGFFQCMALWPGFSRSASTIMGGMLLGLRRDVAAEYSFIAAVPLMVAATGYDVLRSWHLFSADDLSFFLVGMVSAFVFAILAIKTFIALLRKISLRLFAWYRIILALALFFLLY